VFDPWRRLAPATGRACAFSQYGHVQPLTMRNRDPIM
jgi:hypothetical protein